MKARTRIFQIGCLVSILITSPLQALDTRVTIYRKSKDLVVFDSDRKSLLTAKIGIGRGGLKNKESMSDLITPLGDFSVDLILSKDHEFNAVDSRYIERYRGDSVFSKFIDGTKEGLVALFKNMNSLDFDENGLSDTAYGSAYIGLDSTTAVTGPKMRYFKGTPYWYSIAIHGTIDEKYNLGAANSGGCVHLAEKDLSTLLKNKYITIGTSVTITDSLPEEP